MLRIRSIKTNGRNGVWMKNKYQEAYNRLAFNFGLDVVDGTEYDDEVNDFILFKKLVDRETPRQPYIRQMIDKDGIEWQYISCPKCGNNITGYMHFNYCPDCGQKIDWSKWNGTRNIKDSKWVKRKNWS